MGILIVCRGTVQAADGLTEGQVAAVGIMVAEMFKERHAEKRISLDQVTARASRQGLTISADRIDEVPSNPSAITDLRMHARIPWILSQSIVWCFQRFLHVLSLICALYLLLS